MAGMQGLGRVFDVIGVASGTTFSMKNASAVTFITEASGAESIAFTASKTYSGSTQNWTTANGYGQTAYYYQNTSTTGTAAWTKQTATWTTNSVALAGTNAYMSVFTVYTSQFADGYCYITPTATNSTYLIAVLHDLTVQRTPANLALLGA